MSVDHRPTPLSSALALCLCGVSTAILAPALVQRVAIVAALVGVGLVVAGGREFDGRELRRGQRSGPFDERTSEVVISIPGGRAPYEDSSPALPRRSSPGIGGMHGPSRTTLLTCE